MSLTRRISLTVVVAVLSIGPAMTMAAEGSFKVTTGERQLFLDDFGIETIRGLDRRMHQPLKMGAVIRPDKFVGEEAVQVRGVPLWDPQEKIFKLWLSGTSNPARTSPDGLHWSIAPGPGPGSSLVVYDPNDSDPARRYKAVHTNSGFLVSPDGQQWTRLEAPPVPSMDESNFSYNPKEGLFIHTVKRGGPHGRSVGLATSRDFENWTDYGDDVYGVVFHADDLDQHLGKLRIKARFADPTLHHPCYDIPSTYNVDVYNMSVFRYESLYIGLPQMYYQTGKVPGSWPGFDKLPIPDEYMVHYRRDGDWSGFHDVQLTCSRDLRNWKRLADREPFMTASPKGAGAWDEASEGSPSFPLVRGDELWLYSTVARYYGVVLLEHGRNKPNTAINLATLRRDGFMSLDAGEQEGTIQTKPFELTGSKLLVNVDALKGELRVEVLNDAGQIVAQSELLTGDLLREPVKWTDGNIADLKGRTASLRFTLRNGQFYSYWLE